jgi:hypothetical protein
MDPDVRDAYQRFFTAFNARDATGWSATLNYPHVRLSARTAPEVIANAEDHARRTQWERVTATGWDHSVPKNPQSLHAGRDSAHLLGGWTRYTKDGVAILENEVAYVLTRVHGTWGIQSRFGIDVLGDGSAATNAEAVAVVEEYLDACSNRDWRRACDCLVFPTFLIAPGNLKEWRDCPSFVAMLESGHWHLLTEASARAVQGGATAVNVAVEVLLDGGDRRQQALFMVVRRDDRWGIQGRSIVEA